MSNKMNRIFYWLKSLTAPPLFADEQKNRTASMLNIMQWLMLGCVVFLALIGLVAGKPEFLSTTLTISVAIIVTMIIAHRGDLFFASLSLLLLTLGAVTLQLFQSNGIHDVLLLSYLTLIVIASLLLNPQFFIIFTLVELACLAFLVFGEIYGLFTSRFSGLTDPTDFFLIGAILLLTALAVRLMADKISQSLQQARTELRERQQAEQALRESRAFLADLIEHSGALIFVKDIEGRYELVNRKWEEVTRFHRSQVIGRTDLELFPGEIGEQFRRNDLSVIHSDSVQEVEEMLYDPAGRRYFISIKFPLHGGDGSVKGLGGMTTETTDRRRAQEALRAADQRIKLHFEQTPLAIIEWDLDFCVTAWNPAAEVIFGYARAEALHRHASFIVPESDLDSINQVWQLLLQQSNGNRTNNLNVHKDGRTIRCEWYNTPLVNEDGQVVGVASLVQDVSARWQAEAKLRESEETLRLIVEQTGQIVYELDLANGRGHWYGAMGSLLGYTFEEFLLLTAQDWGELVHPQDRPKVQDWRNEVIATVGQYSMAYHFQHKDGHYLYIEDNGVVLSGADGKAARIVGAIKDISVRKRIEDEIRQQSKRAQVMAEISQILAGMTRDPQQLMDTVLQRCAELIGDGASIFLYDPKAPYLQLASVANPNPEQVKVFRAEIEAHPIRTDEAAYGTVISTGQPLLFPHINLEKLKENAPDERRAYYDQLPLYSAMFAPLHVEGKVLGVIGMGRHYIDHPAYTPDDLNFLQDIADRAAMALLNAQLYATLEERVQQRTAELEAANKELEAFSYSVSHDLRAPLRAIDGFSRLLLSDHPADLDPDALTFINRIREGAQQMGKLIDDILAFSRLSRHTMQKQPVKLRQLAQETFNNLHAAYPSLKVDFQLGDLPEVNADPALIRQVFVNLIDNALKYSSKREESRIEIGCTQGETEITCFIRDNGAGFDMRYAGKLFGVFQRLHRVDEFEGTGIGLANVKRIIDRHAGRIWAESEPGQGAIFYFTLPVQP